MTTKAAESSDLQKMKQEADDNLRHKGIKPKHPLPEDFVNPPKGDRGHLCLDPQGNYRPRWSCVKIHKTDSNLPSYQTFNLKWGNRGQHGKKWRIKVGEWVDVPPAVVTMLDDCVEEVISLDIGKSNPLVHDFVPMVVDEMPRFSFSCIPSA